MATAGPISAIRSLAERPENSRCAECLVSPTTVASLDTGGTFACNACAIAYRKAGLRTKSIERDRWQEAEVAAMQGNLAVAQQLERNLPAFYRRPLPHADADVIRQQFVLAKYKRKEFTDPAMQVAYHRLGGGGFSKEGALMKRLKDSDKYLPRHFELSEKNNYLRYFVKDGQREAKNTIPIDQVNVTMLGSAVDGHPNLMQIMFPQGSRTRSLYVYHDEDQEIINWYNAVRGCKYYRYQMSLLSADELRQLTLTYDFIICDWLCKTGPNQTEAWKRRWCFLLRRSIFYFTNFMEPLAKGEIWLGERPGFSVESGAPANFKKKPVGHIFTLRTPDRDYVFSAETQDACRRWIYAIDEVLDSQPTPQDFLYSKTRSNSA
ncbi:hypothetical protein BOX15_Mlig020530g3 [Macrostomum lignano]|uniref:PH domain-containing protein n=1 Tax=Macrostomum lignano TaxID=282301 RepID=A0A267H5Z1_9PLAT|nr:hypothetical protein BOX15_Mlig020530g3 [Macrostomum lignano]